MNAHLQHTAARMGQVRRLHFIGIGGAGMSGIAELMTNLGYEITGSDQRESETTRRLRELGLMIFIGHRADQMQDVDAVVVSSAIDGNNPEILKARAQRIPIVRRAEMLAELMRFYYGIAIAGTHGKTTTTSLVASILSEAGLDPTFVIGGKLTSAGVNAKLGTTKYLVAEADESDASFLYLQPMIAIVTNIDADHLHTYGNDFVQLKRTFLEFLHHLPFYGLAVLCIDDEEIRAALPQVARPLRTYGTSPDADVRATEITQSGLRTEFLLHAAEFKSPVSITLNLPGKHNVLNALAAICVALELGIDENSLMRALKHFEGVGRRFVTSELTDRQGRNLLLIDDYGHHPRELAAILAAARAGWPGRRIVLVFQPHRYTRTQEQFEDFVAVLSTTDILILTEVYSAGETVIQGADGRALSRAIRVRGAIDPIFAQGLDEIPNLLEKILIDNDLVLIAGAGDIGGLAARLPLLLKNGDSSEN